VIRFFLESFLNLETVWNKRTWEDHLHSSFIKMFQSQWQFGLDREFQAKESTQQEQL